MAPRIVPSTRPGRRSRKCLTKYFADLCDAPLVNPSHPPREFGSQVSTRKMDVLHGGSQTAMPGKGGNCGCSQPARARSVRER